MRLALDQWGDHTDNEWLTSTEFSSLHPDQDRQQPRRDPSLQGIEDPFDDDIDQVLDAVAQTACSSGALLDLPAEVLTTARVKGGDISPYLDGANSIEAIAKRLIEHQIHDATDNRSALSDVMWPLSLIVKIDSQSGRDQLGNVLHAYRSLSADYIDKGMTIDRHGSNGDLLLALSRFAFEHFGTDHGEEILQTLNQCEVDTVRKRNLVEKLVNEFKLPFERVVAVLGEDVRRLPGLMFGSAD